MYQLFYAPDNASLVVRMLLESLGVGYQAVLVDRSQSMQKSSDYLSLNPSGLIPVCIIDGQPVYETAAILLALSERHQCLAPAVGDRSRPQFLKWLFFLSNSVHTDLRQLFYPQQYVGEHKESLHVFRLQGEARFHQRLRILDQHCGSQCGGLLLGEAMTILDFYLAVMLRWAQLYPIASPSVADVNDYPALCRLVAEVAKLDAVARACEKEGIAKPFFNGPSYAMPSEGSAT